MIDILLDLDGDIRVSPKGDISLTDSVRQAVLIKLRWIYKEWRLGPEFGFPWFEEVFVKNPNTMRIKSIIQTKVKEVEGVEDAVVTKIEYNPSSRNAKFYYTIKVGGEKYDEEVILYDYLRNE